MENGALLKLRVISEIIKNVSYVFLILCVIGICFQLSNKFRSGEKPNKSFHENEENIEIWIPLGNNVSARYSKFSSTPILLTDGIINEKISVRVGQAITFNLSGYSVPIHDDRISISTSKVYIGDITIDIPSDEFRRKALIEKFKRIFHV